MPQIFIDGHVHVHSCFDLEEVLACACRNFQILEQETGSGQAACFLLLSESAGADAYAALAARAAEQQPVLGDFHIRATAEAGVLECLAHSGRRIFVVAGRQIVTAERLEVLALGHEAPFADGQAIAEVLVQLAARPCLCVLPWGAGKWLGRRGQVAQDLIGQSGHEPHPAAFFLGDNGNRPFFWPLPALFARAASRGIRNLAGSDPLPFPGQENKVGSFGVRLSGRIDPLRPFSSLRTLLQNPELRLHPFGRTERLYPFLKHQLWMQFSKKSPFTSPVA